MEEGPEGSDPSGVIFQLTFFYAHSSSAIRCDLVLKIVN